MPTTDTFLRGLAMHAALTSPIGDSPERDAEAYLAILSAWAFSGGSPTYSGLPRFSVVRAA